MCALFVFFNASVAEVLKKRGKNKRDPSHSFVFCLQGSLDAVVGRPQITHSAQDDIFIHFFNSPDMLVVLSVRGRLSGYGYRVCPRTCKPIRGSSHDALSSIHRLFQQHREFLSMSALFSKPSRHCCASPSTPVHAMLSPGLSDVPTASTSTASWLSQLPFQRIFPAVTEIAR
jgi:hypothetical protein